MDELLAAYAQNDLSITATLANLAMGLVLGLVLKFHYERFSSVMSGKRELARILPFLILIVCLIISIVKSSLALSLGLVGALSIVRFRTPIKEPEELVYLFMAIAIGLGLGANQLMLTVVATFAILFAVALIRWKLHAHEAKALYLLVEVPSRKGEELDTNIINLVVSHSDGCELKRLDRRDGILSATFLVDLLDTEAAFGLVDELNSVYEDSSVTIIDQSRIPGV